MSIKHRQPGLEVLNDPIVRQMMHADGVSHVELARLLRDVATTLDHTSERVPPMIVVQRAIRTAAIVSRIPLA